MTKRSTKPAALVTKESLQALIDAAYTLDNPNDRLQHIIGRALVGIYKRQTASEQVTHDTKEDNGVGFAGCDARGGSLTAKSYLRSQTLVTWQIEGWTRRASNGYARICKYAKQLNEIALEKQQSKALRLLHATQLPIDDTKET